MLTKPLPGFSGVLGRGGYHVLHWGKTTNKAAKRVDKPHALPINY